MECTKRWTLLLTPGLFSQVGGVHSAQCTPLMYPPFIYPVERGANNNWSTVTPLIMPAFRPAIFYCTGAIISVGAINTIGRPYGRLG